MTHGHGPDIIWETQSANFSTLAGNTVAVSAGLAQEADFRMTRMELFVSLSGWTTTLAVGPLWIFLKPQAISTALLEALIEQDGPVEPEDAQEQANAQEFRAWPICQLVAPIGTDGQAQVPNRGMPIVLKPNYTFRGNDDETGGWNFAMYNMSGSAFGSETKNVKFNSKIFGKWVN